MDEQKTAPRADGVFLSVEALQAVISAVEFTIVVGLDHVDMNAALEAMSAVETMAKGGPVRVVRA